MGHSTGGWSRFASRDEVHRPPESVPVTGREFNVSFEHVLSVIPVSDLDASKVWYERLFGRPADNDPMPVLVEWQVVPGGWVQVFVDEERAASGLVNFAVEDLEAHVRDAEERGLAPGEIEGVNKGVELAIIEDPDGNVIRLIGNLRVTY